MFFIDQSKCNIFVIIIFIANMPETPQKPKEKKTTHLNREKKIQNNYIRIKVGTTNVIKPSSIYVEMSFFVMPPVHLSNNSKIKEVISYIKKQFKFIVKDTIIKQTELFKTTFISIFDTSVSGMKPGKKSYVSIQMSLGQVETPPLELSNVIEDLKEPLSLLILKLTDEFSQFGFTVYKTKN